MAKRIAIAVVVAVVVFVVTFVAFNFLYIQWAVWRYPHNNSMAGLAAFIYGLPVAAGFALLGFAAAARWTKPKRSD